MAIALDLVIRPAPDGVAEARQILHQQSNGIAFSVWQQPCHHFASKTVERDRREHGPWINRSAIAPIAATGTLRRGLIIDLLVSAAPIDVSHGAVRSLSSTRSLKSAPGRLGRRRTTSRPASLQVCRQILAALCPAPS